MSRSRRGDAALSTLAGVAAVALMAVVAALVSQHRFDLQPCAWCVLQRVIMMCIAVMALLGSALGRISLRLVRGMAGLVLLLTTAGAAAALWQHFVAARSASCAMTLADRLLSQTGLDRALPEVFAAYASCADAKVNLFGLPYEFWSLGLFLLLAGGALRALRLAR